MGTIVNGIVLIILCLLVIRIYFSKSIRFRCVPYDKNKGLNYLLNKEIYFLTFTVCTAPFFLEPFSLIRYGFWFIILIGLLFSKRITLKFELITFCYLIFLIWSLFTSIYSTARYEGFMLLIKYLIPLLFLWLSYAAIRDEFTLLYFIKSVNKSAAIYALLIGGISAIFMPWLYWSPIGNMFLKYAGLADYFTSLFPIPLMLYFLTKRKIYLLAAGWLLLSTILESVRTGLGGMTLAGIFVFFFVYKLKSIPFILASIVCFLYIILYVPSVNEKMFGNDNIGKISTYDIVHNDALSLDNIQTSGRRELWTLSLARFYEPNKIAGAGLGETNRFIKERAQKEHTIALLHNDYVQILSDTGLIGIGLFMLFGLTILFKVCKFVIFKRSNIWIKVSGIMAVASTAGTAFSMGFDNVVSHSMTSMINPFIFLGFFLKFIDMQHEQKN